MPRRIPDYPDAYLNWNSVSSFGSNITTIGILIFFFIIFEALSSENDKLNINTLGFFNNFFNIRLNNITFSFFHGAYLYITFYFFRFAWELIERLDYSTKWIRYANLEEKIHHVLYFFYALFVKNKYIQDPFTAAHINSLLNYHLVIKEKIIAKIKTYKIVIFFFNLLKTLEQHAQKRARAHKIAMKRIHRNKAYQKHSFHLVTPSPWPILVAFAAFLLTTGGVLYFHNYAYGSFLLTMGLLFVICFKLLWFENVIIEGTFLGNHTFVVQRGLRLGFILFVVSEVMFFFAFFWAFFHAALVPTFQIDGIWPPYGLVNLVFNFFEVPLLNTFILLLSGATITWAHYSLIRGFFLETWYALIYTLILAFFFVAFQGYEYYEALFTISDGIYGSTFFMATGFHGFHVIIGSIFILICFIRFTLAQFSKKHHIGFETACWYWHFVDVVWLFLVICIYIWGNTTSI